MTHYWIVKVFFITILLSGCSTFDKKLLTDRQKFVFQSCAVVYCNNTERSIIKAAGLKIIQIVALSQNVDLDLKRGFCEEYYSRPVLDYRFAKISALDVCNEWNLKNE